jgi:spore maturation protein CgeB
MACGCVLLAYDQGEAESQALGLRDMHNIVFYQSIPHLQEKLAMLRADPEMEARIARNGRDLAISRFSFAQIGRQIVEALEPALRVRAPLSLLDKFRLKLGI